ncbi:MAG: quinone-dependent dihydroorotate dehydrogenase [Patescibacteria group bacterium]
MYDLIIYFRNTILGTFYRLITKPIFFLQDPENVHDRMLRFGAFLGRHTLTRAVTRLFFDYRNKSLEQNILGINFKNPVGLAAGFDKDACLTDILPSVGFGFAEVGSITGRPCEGNPKPRLWRLKKSQSLVVNYGLKNEGCEKISARLRTKKFEIPVGVSVAKTNCKETAETGCGIDDYAVAFSSVADIASFITINISCPNAFGGEPFTSAERLEKLLARLDGVPMTRPVFLKLPADIESSSVDATLDIISRHRVHGFVICNLTKKRDNPMILDSNVPVMGSISGPVMRERSNELISYVYGKVGKKYVIIGTGGIFTAEDAYEKILRGASLVQLITGMIYQGPQVISEINRGLVRLLNRDGYRTIGSAIGTKIDEDMALLRASSKSFVFWDNNKDNAY